MSSSNAADPGQPGASAFREASRRRDRRLAATGHKPHGLKRVVAFLFGPSAVEKRELLRERNWSAGAEGEVMLAAHLVRSCAAVPLLHDRRMPGSRANIDHIAVAASGIYVIDAKRYRGKIEVHKPLFGAPKLTIDGRDRTRLIAGLARQVSAVEAAVSDIAPGVPVHGCLCFLTPEKPRGEIGLPLLRTLRIDGYPLYYPRRLSRRLNRSGSLTPERARELHAALAQRLSPA